jgi:hypothetical protein
MDSNYWHTALWCTGNRYHQSDHKEVRLLTETSDSLYSLILIVVVATSHSCPPRGILSQICPPRVLYSSLLICHPAWKFKRMMSVWEGQHTKVVLVYQKHYYCTTSVPIKRKRDILHSKLTNKILLRIGQIMESPQLVEIPIELRVIKKFACMEVSR